MMIKKTSVGSLALLLVGAVSQPLTVSFNSVLAQSVNFSLPNSVPQGTTIRIDGSTSMANLSQSLKQRFEQQYPGTQVSVETGGTSAGLQALLDGKADLAAIGRPLTAQEKAEGLIAVPVARDKIAIVVGTKNPLSKSLDINQFAKIFRGEIKNWSQVGGTAGAIRVVDRPAVNDTRQAFQKYPAFKDAPFETGATAVKLNDESAAAVIQKLGTDGISYLPANQVRGQAGVKAVPMHGTAPTNPKYPFSQPLSYVYKGAPTPAVQAFLGYATAKAGQDAIKASGVEAIALNTSPKVVQANSKAANGKVNPSVNTTANGSANVGGKAAKTFPPGSKAASLNAPTSSQTGENPNNQTALAPSSGATAEAAPERGFSWWWLLPIGSLAALVWMLSKGRSRPSPQAYNPPPGYEDENFPGGFDPHQSNQDLEATRSQFNSPLGGVGTESYLDHDRDTTGLDAETDQNLRSLNFLESAANPTSDAATTGGSPLVTGAAIAGGAGAAAWSFLSGNRSQSAPSLNGETAKAAPVSELDSLPRVETEGQISILPRSAEWVTIRWDVPRSLRADAPRQGGERLMVRLYDVTGLDPATQIPDRFEQFDCDDQALSCNVPISASDRTYMAEIGYLSADDRWTRFARSTPVFIPSIERMG
jgi:phosphate transport system substrate-binding protein